MANRYFGTDGIRDVANRGNLTPSSIMITAQCLASRLIVSSPGRERFRVCIAADTRISGSMILAALTAGLTSLGVDVTDFGVLPTPGLSYLTRTRGFDMGIMISASHNPMADNGIKVFHSDGFKISDAMEASVEGFIDDPASIQALPAGGGLGRSVSDPTGLEEYVSHQVDRFADGIFNGLTVAVDCAHGATWRSAPEVLTRLGARVHVMANAPNGININDACGSVHVEALRELVLAEGCDVGLALDGDGDRSLFIDASGGVIDGDAYMAFIGPWLHGKGKLAGGTVVTTVMSNIGLEVALRKEGIRMVRTSVGDRHVTERMKNDGYVLGGEQSGHLIFGADNNFSGDGTYSALRLFEAMVERGRPLAELVSSMERFPQLLVNVPVTSRPPIEELPSVMKRIAEAEEILGKEGRVLVRYSGTEKKARVMIEGRDAARVENLTQSIADAIRAEIGQ